MAKIAKRTTKHRPICVDQASGKLIAWKGIVKVQRSLSPGPASILIYDETRFIMAEFPAAKEHLDLFSEGELRIYVEVLIYEDGMMEVIDKVTLEVEW